MLMSIQPYARKLLLGLDIACGMYYLVSLIRSRYRLDLIVKPKQHSRGVLHRDLKAGIDADADVVVV